MRSERAPKDKFNRPAGVLKVNEEEQRPLQPRDFCNSFVIRVVKIKFDNRFVFAIRDKITVWCQ